jgi:hypothetical protein
MAAQLELRKREILLTLEQMERNLNFTFKPVIPCREK